MFDNGHDEAEWVGYQYPSMRLQIWLPELNLITDAHIALCRTMAEAANELEELLR